MKDLVDPADDKAGDRLGNTLAQLLAVARANNEMLQQLLAGRPAAP